MSDNDLITWASDLVVGIDQFEISDIVNRSSFGEFHDAVDKQTGEKVVVKFVRDLTNFYSDVMKMLMREIKFLRERHPLIVELVGFGLIANAECFMVFKPAPCVPLEHVLRSEMKGLSPDGWDGTSKSKCVFGIAAAMCVVHSRNYLHRDLKTYNVLLDEQLEPVIGGFDLVRQYDPTMTMSVGTPLFMAPELWGSDPYDNKVDVFSFAVLLRRFFTESLELDDNQTEARSAAQLMPRVGQGARLVRTEGIPDFYWDLITRCWNQDPKMRPSFQEIVALLHENTEQYIFPDADIDEVKEYEARIIATIPQGQ